MFNQRKSFFKGKLFYIILLALFAFGIWLNAPIDNDDPKEVEADSNYQTSGSGVSKDDKEPYDIMDNIIGKAQTVTQSGATVIDSAEKSSETENRGYYLVKEIDGIIMIFYYNEEGKESLIRETDIAFSLLSNTDQELFQKGVIKHTPEELDELLQDFES